MHILRLFSFSFNLSQFIYHYNAVSTVLPCGNKYITKNNSYGIIKEVSYDVHFTNT